MNHEGRTALSVPELAKAVGKSERTIRAWIHRGTLAAGRPTDRGPFLISAEEVMRLMLPDAPFVSEDQTAGK